MLQLHCPSGASLSLRNLSHCLQLLQPSFGQLLCPAIPLHSLLPSFASFRFIFRLSNCFRSRVFKPSHKIHFTKHTCRFASPIAHSTSLRSATSFIHFSRLQSTRCRCCCARLAACLGCGLSWFLLPDAQPLAVTKTHANPCVSLLLYIAPQMRCSLYSTVAGTRRQFRRASSIAFDGEQPGSGLDKFAKPALLLLAAGAITFLLRTNSHTLFLI